MANKKENLRGIAGSKQPKQETNIFTTEHQAAMEAWRS
jgi:hypothetical protein